MIWQLLLFLLVVVLLREVVYRRKVFRLREELGYGGPPVTNVMKGNVDIAQNFALTRGIAAMPEFFPEMVAKYDSIFGFYFGPTLDLIVTDPALIQEIFISQFHNFVNRKYTSIQLVYPMVNGLLQVDQHGTHGVGWKEIRSVVSAIFTSGKMKRMHLMFHDQLENLIREMRSKAKLNNGSVEIYAEYQAMTMDMIARCALGQNISCIKDRHNFFYTTARRFVFNFSFLKSTVMRLATFFPIARFLRPYSTFGRAEATIVRELEHIVKSRIKERGTQHVSRSLPDLIDLILDENDKRVKNGDIPLHEEVVVSNLWSLFFAGYETTSTALAFSSALLARHPQVQQTLYEEIVGAFGHAETIDYERVMKLQYLHAVFCESLRHSPPVASFTYRQCTHSTVIGGKYQVPEGVNIVVPVNAVMWSEDNFTDPRSFIPERFLGDRLATWSSTFLPFGIGPRNCVGARFAEMEYKTVLAEVTRNFVMEVDPEHPKLERMFMSALILPLDNKLFVRLVPRAKS